MKRIIIGLVVALASAQTANADVYVKVDAQGNAIGGAIICDAATCGAGSLYSQLTLGEGERYVLQGVNVHYGIGNNNPGVEVKHEATTNQWVVTNNNTPEPVVERFTTIETRPTPNIPVVLPDTSTARNDTATVINETRTVIIETQTVAIDYATLNWEDVDWKTFDWVSFIAWFQKWFDQIMYGVRP
jgi:opacity protein-like surface antigen